MFAGVSFTKKTFSGKMYKIGLLCHNGQMETRFPLNAGAGSGVAAVEQPPSAHAPRSAAPPNQQPNPSKEQHEKQVKMPKSHFGFFEKYRSFFEKFLHFNVKFRKFFGFNF
jgi:hypothetical protein